MQFSFVVAAPARLGPEARLGTGPVRHGPGARHGPERGPPRPEARRDHLGHLCFTGRSSRLFQGFVVVHILESGQGPDGRHSEKHLQLHRDS